MRLKHGRNLGSWGKEGQRKGESQERAMYEAVKTIKEEKCGSWVNRYVC